MKNFKIIPLVLIVLMCLPLLIPEVKSQPHDRNFGLGVVLGEPSGITGKQWLSQHNALSGTVAWSFRGRDKIHIHIDYLRHNFETITVERGSMAFFYGLGGRLLTGDKNQIGVRVPFGLSYFFPNDPLEIFLELAPILDLAPETEFTGNSGLGLRYYF